LRCGQQFNKEKVPWELGTAAVLGSLDLLKNRIEELESNLTDCQERLQFAESKGQALLTFLQDAPLPDEINAVAYDLWYEVDRVRALATVCKGNE